MNMHMQNDDRADSLADRVKRNTRSNGERRRRRRSDRKNGKSEREREKERGPSIVHILIGGHVVRVQ